MKKLALFLGSLFVVATAQAKEAVVAPVEVSKEIIVVAEPVVEVIKPAFRPSGYLSMQYKWYGKTEGHGDRVPAVQFGEDGSVVDNNWNQGYNNYSRLQTMVGVQATEKIHLEARIRDYNNLERHDDSRGNAINGTQTRLRALYKHDDLFASRLQYRDLAGGAQDLEYQARFTVWQDKGAFLSNVVLAPKVSHYFPKDGGSAYKNGIGMNIEYAGNLPLGFTWDGTIYLDETFYGNGSKFYSGADYVTNELKSKKDKDFAVTWEFYIYRSFALYSTDNYSIDFNFDGGYDPYVFGQYNRYSLVEGKDINGKEYTTISKSSKDSYSLYMALAIDADYQLTEYITAFAGAGAEYRNWDYANQDSASHWRWQPFAYVGVKTVF